MIKYFAGWAAALISIAQAGAAAGVLDEVRGGVVAQSCCGPGNDKEQGVGLNGEIIFRPFWADTGPGALRPLIGATIATDSDATSQFYGALEYNIALPGRLFLAASAGGAIHNGEADDFDPVADAGRVNNTLFLGCRASFRVSADFGYRVTERLRASVHWSHLSNAGLCRENEGLDTLGARLGLSF